MYTFETSFISVYLENSDIMPVKNHNHYRILFSIDSEVNEINFGFSEEI